MLASTTGEGGERGREYWFSRTSYTVEKYNYLPSISGAVESKLLPMRRSTQIATSSQCSTNMYTYFHQQKTCACVCTYTSTYFSLPQNLFDSLDRGGSGHAQLVRHILQHSLYTMYIYMYIHVEKKDSVNIMNNNTFRIFPFGCGTHTSLLHGKCPTFQFKSV